MRSPRGLLVGLVAATATALVARTVYTPVAAVAAKPCVMAGDTCTAGGASAAACEAGTKCVVAKCRRRVAKGGSCAARAKTYCADGLSRQSGSTCAAGTCQTQTRVSSYLGACGAGSSNTCGPNLTCGLGRCKLWL